ncbi:SMC-Scp complex subunit ScpB [Acidihalobacter aeolianus]|uniref:SMC-Scp complex subunit ScpB n=1 Tax=Acidihalobacter aeolianus TaxID=2792603 RepID=A0A1D8K8B5_9GAMM|nr:SMC-Scp complex subunit ScpB [Acidihalobacter aeolianus]AOV17217.1 SMC-Scp complex subunit ScpB [Acidihalobacter aeolianus]
MSTLSNLREIIEAALLAAGQPMTLDRLQRLFEGDPGAPDRSTLRQALDELAQDCSTRCYELQEVASGYRLQIKPAYTSWIQRMWEEKPPRYSRATLETLALVAYRQPITRGEIEAVRGVSVSSHILKGLQERDWIKVVGHREVPGRPALYATTRSFLDYFGLKSLDELPPLAEFTDLDGLHPQLDLGDPETIGADVADVEDRQGESPQSTDEDEA